MYRMNFNTRRMFKRWQSLQVDYARSGSDQVRSEQFQGGRGGAAHVCSIERCGGHRAWEATCTDVLRGTPLREKIVEPVARRVFPNGSACRMVGTHVVSN